MVMTDQSSTPLRRIAVLGRRMLLLIAVAALVGSVASTSLDRSVALAERAPLVPGSAKTSPEPPRTQKPVGAPSGRLNLNTASGSELELLPGIGPTKAERVLAFRGKHGPFKRVFDLRRVKGFGKKTVDRLSPFLTVTEKTSLRAD
jgi:competence protein ComEA